MPFFLVYVFQQTDYEMPRFYSVIRSIPDITNLRKRGRLEKTTKVKLLLIFAYALYFACIATIVCALLTGSYYLLFGMLILLPLVCISGLVIVIAIANTIVGALRSRYISKASIILANHKGYKIAVLGSYGKTSMKELLIEVIGSSKKISATTGNKNVPISISRWAGKLNGDEDILIVEYGESKPGDIAKLAKLTHPDFVVATGVAPNHLDFYKTEEALAHDFKSVTNYVAAKNIYANIQMKHVFQGETDVTFYSETNIGQWKIKNIEVTIKGIYFELVQPKASIKISSHLLGRHNIGPLAAVALLAMRLGVPIKKIEQSIANTKPYDHRMKPRQLHGAWLIDDTYNGNLEGFKAGLALLKELPAKRKIYVTPGLVSQGALTEAVHIEIGEKIAIANPDIVVLMDNSVTKFIMSGLDTQNYHGSIKIESDPLAFYTNLDQFVANGDLILMQNDWPDGYR